MRCRVDLFTQRTDALVIARRPGGSRHRSVARYSPNTLRSDAAHSPVVTPAFAQAMDGGIRFASPLAARSRSSSAFAAAAASRVSRHCFRRPICPSSADGSTVTKVCRRLRSAAKARFPCRHSRRRGFPRRARSLRHALRWRRQAVPSCIRVPAATRRRRASAIRAISSRIWLTSCSTLASITFDPSKISPYSSMSVSNAPICCRRSDHCWSHGRGRPSASFHAGSCTARARAFFDSVTPSMPNSTR